MPDERFRVEATALNIRSEPVVAARTRLGVLPNGQVVTRLEGGPGDEWWRVAAELQGARVEGWLASRYVAPVGESSAPAPVRRVRAVHLGEDNRAVRRDVAGHQAFPLGEPGRPARGATTSAGRARELIRIIDWLEVDRSARYQSVGNTTYCNIYAYDYAYVAGGYLPRVWWTPRALARIASGGAVAPRYAETVTELNANMIYQWLVDYGADFDWTRTFDLTELQDAANDGGIGVICAQRADLNRPGHIAMVAPETAAHQAARNGGAVVRPLQSQAGSRCFRYDPGTQAWWTRGGPTGFGAFGLWHHP